MLLIIGSLTATVRNGTAYQSWDLDSLGNAASITTQGVEQENTYNQQNQMTSAGSASLLFDANGNTTTDDHGYTLVYDAWNRLVAVKTSSNGDTLATYGYDALGRRVTESYPDQSITKQLYYSSQWQVLEERQGAGTQGGMLQYVWSPEYVDSLLLRDEMVDGVLIQRLYAQHDANYNVTALTDEAGQVVERYVYDAYGKVTILTPDGLLRGEEPVVSSSYNWQYMHQGGRCDAVSGLYGFRHRDYSPTLQRWVQQDPMGYVDGASLYQYVTGNPINMVDPLGLCALEDEKNKKAMEDNLVNMLSGFGDAWEKSGVPGGWTVKSFTNGVKTVKKVEQFIEKPTVENGLKAASAIGNTVKTLAPKVGEKILIPVKAATDVYTIVTDGPKLVEEAVGTVKAVGDSYSNTSDQIGAGRKKQAEDAVTNSRDFDRDLERYGGKRR